MTASGSGRRRGSRRSLLRRWTGVRLGTALLVALAVLVPGFPGVSGSTAQAAACPCSIWGPTATPAHPADGDTSAVELGVKLRSDTAGYITGIRFYKGPGNTGTHVGSLWGTDGTRLASATFSGETTSGWQQVSFAAPVSVTAGTTYVASYYAPAGHYAADGGAFASGVDNAPLHALADGVDGADGVYRYGTGGGFPVNTYNSTNYWVDVLFTTTVNDTTPPVVTSRSPAPGATDVPVTAAVTATFSEPVSGAAVSVSAAAGAVAGATSYDAPTRTVRFTPSAALSSSTSYSVAVSGATDAAGNAMAGVDNWSFVTSATSGGCPCSLWPTSAVPGTAASNDTSAVEVGTRFSSDINGYVTGLRFYKGAGNGGTHVGHLWAADGTLLSTATYAAESATGWQQVTLPSPVAVTAGTSYIASYYAQQGAYSLDNGYFSTARVAAPLRAPADGAAANGVYRYGASGFPTSTFSSSNYWVDVVFDTTAVDSTPPKVVSTAPGNGTSGIAVTTDVTAAFSETVDQATLSFSLTDGSGAAVASTTSYDGATNTARLHPAAALAASTRYTATVSAKDLAGNAMPAPVTWSFTTVTPPPPPPVLDGPVLVVAPSATSFGAFLPEILRAEGLNAYAKADLTALTATTLAKYDAVVLGETPLTAAQVQTLTTWVNAGGNLIAMRPDKQLAGLLGLTAVTVAPTTYANAYLTVNTASGPGVGITNQSIQFHGTADRYTLNGATSVATLYSTATAATTNPAVTVRDVGTSGGSAAAFTFDLARSVVYTRQGNPAYAGQERDGQTPIRSDDMFWGSTATNGWVNLNKVQIPQADEQQRLLLNVLESINKDKKPLPRFWYFPRMAKAVVVGTGDDHGNGGTAGRMDQYLANSPAGCSVALWTCLRTTSYMYTSTPLTDNQAAAYDAQGFELGLHEQNGCGNFTPASLENDYLTQLSDWQAKYASLSAPVTNRYHCLVFSDWASQPKTELRHGMGLDANYYYWPGSWMSAKPGFMTGSGIPMHFADIDGSVLGTYQAATQMTDESGQSFPATPNTLFDNANGPLGYYGAFTVNMHTDQPTTFEDDQLLASAQARGVPIVSARQMLTWLQGRDASSFSAISWSGGTLSFTIGQASGADGLNAMLPTAGSTGPLTSLTSAGAAVPFTRQTIKGIEYAVFDAVSGSYTASYGAAAPAAATMLAAAPAAGATAGSAGSASLPGVYERPGPGRAADTSGKAAAALMSAGTSRLAPGTSRAAAPDVTAPTVTGLDVFSLPDGSATVTWRSNEAADSTVAYGRSPAASDSTRNDPAMVTSHSVVLTGLVPGATYYLRVTSADPAGNVSSTATDPLRFVQSAAGVADSSAASLRVGTGDGASYVSSTTDGELQLLGDQAAEFDRPQLPAQWSTEAEQGGRTVIYGGSMRLDGTRALGPLLTGPRSLSASVTFNGADQFAGLAAGITGPWAMFGGRGGHLYASINTGRSRVDTQLPDILVGSPHVYSIDWTSTGVSLSVDGAPVASGALTAPAMRPLVRDLVGDGSPLTVDWLRESVYRKASSYVSRVLDAQQMVIWDRAVWRADVPAGTSLRVSVRTGSRPTPDGTWTAFTPLSGPGALIGTAGRYLQYRVDLATTAPTRTPVLTGIGFTHNGDAAPRDPDVG